MRSGMAHRQFERKLATILVADVVGYSRLMSRDEEGTHRRFQDLRRAIIGPDFQLCHGRIVHTAGDGFLVEFSSAVEAVRCAVKVQRDMLARTAGSEDTRIVLRIGIHLGDILIEARDVFGDDVNIAARLESLCEPGGILVSGAVRTPSSYGGTGAADQMADEPWHVVQCKSAFRPCLPHFRTESRL
jgi:adenylate cyclase